MQQTRIDLYCLPCAGASATMYMRWRRLLPSWINVVPVELPGRGMRMGEPCLESFNDLVSLICDDIRHRLPKKWAFFGHSMGALLAFGVADRLRMHGHVMPLTLFASASPAPSRRNADRIPDTNDDAALIADMHQQGGTPSELFENPELLQMTLDTLRSDYRVCQSYRHVPSEPFDFPITVLAGRQDDIELNRIEAWWDETEQGFSLHWFDGGHFFIKDKENHVLRVIEKNLTELV